MENKELFINSYLNKISKKYEINLNDAFQVFSIAAILERTPEFVFENVIIKDTKNGKIGKKDGGIDGVYFIDQDDYFQMFVFQCKNSKSLKPNEIDKFRNDFKDVFIDGNKVGKINIEDLQPKIDEYKQLTNSGYIIEPKLFFLYNGQNDDPNYAQNSSTYQTYHNQFGDFEIWDSNDIYSKIRQIVLAQSKRKEVKFIFHPKTSNISFSDNQGLYTYSIENVRAANFRIEALELCKIMDQEKEINGSYEYLFSENIRGFLGTRVKANKNMLDTLKSEYPIFFPFLNNGITLIADKIVIPNSPQVGEYNLPATNPVIVNGLQTTRVIYKVYSEKPENLKNVFINIRIYETDDKELIKKITDATNTQSPINFRDKISNEDFNKWTKDLFKNNNIGYITKRGEYFSKLMLEYENTIESDTLLKFWWATFYERPEIAKSKISYILEEIFDATSNMHRSLNYLFNGHKDSPIYSQLLYTYKIYTFVQTQKRNSEFFKQYMAYADELICYGIYLINKAELKSIDIGDKLLQSYRKVIKIIDEMIDEQIVLYQEHNKVFSLANFFKSNCRVEYNRKIDYIENENVANDLKTLR